MNNFNYVLHAGCYYTLWLICILFASAGHGLLGVVIAMPLVGIQFYWQFFFSKNTLRLFYFILMMTILGSLVDTIFLRSNLLVFTSNPFSPYFIPPWMMMIWISFSIVLFSTLSWLFKRYFILGVLSFFGFSISYGLGVKMGAAIFPGGYSTSLLIGAIWAVILPLCLSIYSWTKII